MDDGHVLVTAIRPIELADISGSLARQCGFKGTVDLLRIAKDGPGSETSFLIDFHVEK